jgi:hypothetical protein
MASGSSHAPDAERLPTRLRARLAQGWLHDRWRLLRARREARSHGADLAGVGVYCLFIGHARSGHSILGALLGAHPAAVFSDEMDALHYLKAGFSRRDLLALSVSVAREQSSGRQKRGRDGGTYSYEVPGWWQGRWDELGVVGDSLAGRTVQALDAEPGLVERMDGLMQPAAVKYLHVVRDPFDNISTMMIRGGRSFEGAAERYFATCSALDRVREHVGTERTLTLAHEDIIERPEQQLEAACDLLGLSIPDGYLAACAAILYRSPARSSERIDWDAAMVERVRDGIHRHGYLARYAESRPADRSETDREQPAP